ncbi:DUF4421 domain-containing protein [Cytophagaceae bacterium ABcell3]|nr:DUF4421 domain-containing protein [Cytophagaceae bacterium ABcell3]
MMLKNTFLNIICLTCISFAIKAQIIEDYEEEVEGEHYIVFEDAINSRLYLSQKFTSFRINDRLTGTDYMYMPNTTLNLGIGATYRWATLNLAYGFNFLNPDQGQGDTRYLDLQAHAYPRAMVVDLFGQFYKGYHMLPEGKAAPDGENFYYRPDLVVTKLGASVQYVFNFEKFSFNAAFLQNEWQRKSAGTPLLGFEMYGGRARGDSALIPIELIEDPERNFTRTRFFDLGPNLGYAYTLVFLKNFFVTASASTNLVIGHAIQDGDHYRERDWDVRPNLFFRIFAGYNSERWSLNGNFVYNNVRFASTENFTNSMMTGNYRVNFIYRFIPGGRLKERLQPIRGIDDELSPNNN